MAHSAGEKNLNDRIGGRRGGRIVGAGRADREKISERQTNAAQESDFQEVAARGRVEMGRVVPPCAEHRELAVWHDHPRFSGGSGIVRRAARC